VTVELEEVLPAPPDDEAHTEKTPTTRRVSASELTAAAAAAAAGVADAGRLEHLSAASLLHTLRTRAAHDLYYTCVGSVLVAVNPCKAAAATPAAAAPADASAEALRYNAAVYVARCDASRMG
jgi:hypothetical protein